MNIFRIWLVLLFYAVSCFGMEKLEPVKKLYASDFEKLGVMYTNELICRVDKPKIKYIECNRLMRHKYGQLLAQKHEAPVYLKYINDRVRYGAFADTDIAKDSLIAEYTGELIHEQMFSQIESVDDSAYCMDVGHYYYDASFDPVVTALIVDAKRCGNFTRFINHSSTPNTFPTTIYGGDNLWHVIILANKRIAKGEQLTIDYGNDYWQNRGIVPENLE